LSVRPAEITLTVVANNVPVTLWGIELGRESTNVTDSVLRRQYYQVSL
jgi:hypothetical protein